MVRQGSVSEKCYNCFENCFVEYPRCHETTENPDRKGEAVGDCASALSQGLGALNGGN
jgi:hypothetical protein